MEDGKTLNSDVRLSEHTGRGQFGDFRLSDLKPEPAYHKLFIFYQKQPLRWTYKRPSNTHPILHLNSRLETASHSASSAFSKTHSLYSIKLAVRYPHRSRLRRRGCGHPHQQWPFQPVQHRDQFSAATASKAQVLIPPRAFLPSLESSFKT